MAMPETIQSFLTQVEVAASVLEEPAVSNLVTAVRNQVSAPRLQVLIVGAVGVGRFSVMNALLEKPGLLPASPIPKAPIRVEVEYGTTDTAEVSAQNGLRTAIPFHQLGALLTHSETQAMQYNEVSVTTNCDLLKTSVFVIDSLDAQRSEVEWKELLAGTDYVIVVLRAVALLSEQERRFIREVLHPYFGLERVAIAINQMDLIPGDERSLMAERIRSFLGTFQSQPVLIELSAAQALKGIISGDRVLDSGSEVLMRLVRHDLVENHRLLKSTAVRHAANLCLTEVVNSAIGQSALLSMDSSDLSKVLRKLDGQRQWLQSRIERSQSKIEIFVNTLPKEQLLREIEGFGRALREQLPGEVMVVEDIAAIKRHLPGYLEALWTEFFNAQVESIRSKLVSEMKLIGEIAENDLWELIGVQGVEFQALLEQFDPTPMSMKTFVMPRRGKSEVEKVATGSQLTGCMLLVGAPLLGTPFVIGLTAIGAGQLIRMACRQDIKASTKQAIITSTLNSLQGLERQIKQQVEVYFKELAEELKQVTAQLYEQGIAKLRSIVQEGVERHQNLQDQKEQLDRLLSVTIPELKACLQKMEG